MAKKGLVISLVAVAVVAGLAGYKFTVKSEATTEKAPVAKTAPAKAAPKAAPAKAAPKAAPAAAPTTAPKAAAPSAPLTEKQKADMRARFTERFKVMPAEEKTRRIELLTRALNRESPTRSERAKEIIQLQLDILQGK